MQDLYPLTFQTIFKEKIWGGEKIRTVLGKDFSPLSNCGETWEISGVKGNESMVRNGQLAGYSLPEVIRTFKGDLVGEKVFEKFGDEFPLLVKFIDANDDLSIQVHPDDALAKARHDSFGKTEMWYVIQADENAKLVSGFNKPIDKETYLKYFNEKKLFDILNQEIVHSDDVYFLPAGRVHTIGKGLLIAEIQQTSDITYRIYDFDRRDANGNTRELHVDQALDAIDYQYFDDYKTQYEAANNQPSSLVECDYFHTQKIVFDEIVERNYTDLDSFVIYVCLEGEFELGYGPSQSIRVNKGDAVLVPACFKEIGLHPLKPSNILESYVP